MENRNKALNVLFGFIFTIGLILTMFLGILKLEYGINIPSWVVVLPLLLPVISFVITLFAMIFIDENNK